MYTFYDPADFKTNATFNWSFGDGEYSTSEDPGAHIYAHNGTYTVDLNISSDYGYNTTTRDIVINDVIISAFTYVRDANSNSKITFVDASYGEDLIYLWSFGDGATSALQNPEHEYSARAESYTVTLVITNTTGYSYSQQSLGVGQSIDDFMTGATDDIQGMAVMGTLLIIVSVIIGVVAKVILGRD